MNSFQKFIDAFYANIYENKIGHDYLDSVMIIFHNFIAVFYKYLRHGSPIPLSSRDK